MKSSRVSPGGALLRTSRIFSIPPPLPRPMGDLSSTTDFNSDTATLPYPTHLSIATPQSSLARGDWGFKRPLPLRSTMRSSTPLIRVEAIDTFENVTEYASGAGHSLTLKKWQEMDVPLTTPVLKKRESNFTDTTSGSGKSVFENSIDSTLPTESGSIKQDDSRWKYNGPWLAGQTEGDFNHYLLKEVRQRKREFQEFLRTGCAIAATRESHRTAPERGGDVGAPVKASDITDKQLSDYITALRQDLTELYKQIRKFLDLPPAPAPRVSDDIGFLAGLGIADFTAKPKENFLPISDSPYAESGPPKTHPSAGLFYGRSASHTFNHPLYGPQKYKSPVKGRVVMPKGAATGNFAPALGVGGFVVDVPRGQSSFDLRGTSSRGRGQQNLLLVPGLLNIEPDKVGGSKTHLNLMNASVDPKGRVILSVTPADPEAVAVHEGTVGDIPVPYQRPMPARNLGFPKPAVSSNEGYGLSSGDAVGQVEGKGSGISGQILQKLSGLIEKKIDP